MRSAEPDGSKAGEEVAERTQEETYADEAWREANKAHKRMTVDRQLAVRHVDWASEEMVESLYMHTLWLLKRNGMIRSEVRSIGEIMYRRS